MLVNISANIKWEAFYEKTDRGMFFNCSKYMASCRRLRKEKIDQRSTKNVEDDSARKVSL